MRIGVEVLPWLSGSLRPGSTGKVSIERDFEGAGLRELLLGLSADDRTFAEVIFDTQNGELRYPVLAAVNGKLVDTENGLDTALHEGDRIVLMAAYTGGWLSTSE